MSHILGYQDEVSFVHLAQAVFTQIFFKAKVEMGVSSIMIESVQYIQGLPGDYTLHMAYNVHIAWQNFNSEKG